MNSNDPKFPQKTAAPPFGEFLRFFLMATRPWRWIYLGMFACILLAIGAGYVLPMLQKRLINALTMRQADGIWFLFCVTGALMLLVRSEALFRQRIVNSTVHKVMFSLRTRIMERLLDLPPGLLDQLGGGYLSGRLNTDISHLQLFFSNTLFTVLSNIMKVAGGLIFLFILSPRTGLAILLVFPCYALLLYKFRGRHYTISHQISELNARNQRMVASSLGSIDLVKSNAAESRVGGAIRTGIARETLFRLRAVRLANTFLFLSGLIPLASQGVLAVVGIHLVLRGDWSLGSLWALNCYLMNVFRPLGQLCGMIPLTQATLASAARIIELDHATCEPNLDSGLDDFSLQGRIELRGLSFSYHPGHPVLSSLDLVLEPGSKLLVAGPSGAGKSTLFALLLSFYKPESGEILIDGRPVADYNVRALRRRIGYLGAFPSFIPTSLRANLTLGCPEPPDDAAIFDALAAAGIDSLVHSLPHGLDTVLTESARNFSAGERLRLALARELLRGCSILLIDEATAHLDADNETHFLETVLRVFRSRTVLMIRHTHHPLTDAFPVLRIGASTADSTSADLAENEVRTS